MFVTKQMFEDAAFPFENFFITRNTKLSDFLERGEYFCPVFRWEDILCDQGKEYSEKLKAYQPPAHCIIKGDSLSDGVFCPEKCSVYIHEPVMFGGTEFAFNVSYPLDGKTEAPVQSGPPKFTFYPTHVQHRSKDEQDWPEEMRDICRNALKEVLGDVGKRSCTSFVDAESYMFSWGSLVAAVTWNYHGDEASFHGIVLEFIKDGEGNTGTEE